VFSVLLFCMLLLYTIGKTLSRTLIRKEEKLKIRWRLAGWLTTHQQSILADTVGVSSNPKT
jgi:hypothetical protein